MIKDIGEIDFKKLSLNKLTVIDFYGTWCMPCKMFEPAFEELSKEVYLAEFYKIDVNKNMNLADRYNISSIPCILLFKDGKIIDRLDGSISKEFLHSKIKQYI